MRQSFANRKKITFVSFKRVQCEQKSECMASRGHGAMPLTGINPNWRLAKIICELEKLEQAEKDRLGCHEYLKWPSITPTIISSPAKRRSTDQCSPGRSLYDAGYQNGTGTKP